MGQRWNNGASLDLPNIALKLNDSPADAMGLLTCVESGTVVYADEYQFGLDNYYPALEGKAADCSSGKIGDASSDFVGGLAAITISCYITPTTGSGNHTIIHAPYGSGESRLYFRQQDTEMKWLYRDETGTSRSHTTSGLALQANTSYFVVLSIDVATGQQYLYVDGSEIVARTETTATSIIDASTDGIYFGARENGGDACAAWLDHICVWNKALSTTEIGTLCNSGSPLHLVTEQMRSSAGGAQSARRQQQSIAYGMQSVSQAQRSVAGGGQEVHRQTHTSARSEQSARRYILSIATGAQRAHTNTLSSAYGIVNVNGTSMSVAGGAQSARRHQQSIACGVQSVARKAKSGAAARQHAYTTDGWRVYVDGVEVGFVAADSPTLELTGVAISDGQHLVTVKPSGLFWIDCVGLLSWAVTVESGEATVIGIPSIEDLAIARLRPMHYRLDWSATGQGSSGPESFGIWIGTSTPVDTSGDPDMLVAADSRVEDYTTTVILQETSYVAVAAITGDVVGPSAEVGVTVDTTPPASPANQFAMV